MKTKIIDRHEGDKHSSFSEAEWYQDTADGRWMLRCTHETQYENGMVEKCTYHERESRYVENHQHGKRERGKGKGKNNMNQISLFDVGIVRENENPFLEIFATVAAELNISSSVMTSVEMMELFNQLLEYGYMLGSETKERLVISYSDKVLNTKIVEICKERKKKLLDQYKKYGQASVIVDAGTVRKKHTLEIILVLPGILKPLPYKSYTIGDGDIQDYQKMFKLLFKDLFKEKIQLLSICGDNLPAQRNGVDHTKSKSLQERAYESVLQIQIQLKELIQGSSYSKNKEKLQTKLKYYSELAALLYIPCCSHLLNLAFNDLLKDSEFILSYLNKLEKYNELFKIDIIKKSIGDLHFSICPTRWMYLFDGLIYLYKNRKKLMMLYEYKESKSEIQEILDMEEYEEISTFPKELVYLINILWPLHSFSIFIETDSTLLCSIVPVLDKVILQMKKRCQQYHQEVLGDIIESTIMNRFKTTGRWDLMRAAYLLTPYGRKRTAPKNSQVRKFKTYKTKIRFFELKEELETETEIQKFKDYVMQSKSIKDADDQYFYFEHNSEEIMMLDEESKDKLVLETLSDIEQLKNVSINMIEMNIDLVKKYQDETAVNFASEFKNVWISSKEYFNELYSLFGIFSQNNADIGAISLYFDEISSVDHNLLPEELVSNFDDFFKYMDKFKTNTEAIKDLIYTDKYQNVTIAKHIENLDMLSDDITFHMAEVIQRKDKSSIWNCLEVLSETSEEGTCVIVLNELSKIVYPDINPGAYITPYMDEYIGSYAFNPIIQSQVFSKIYLQYHPILYWKKMIENNPGIKYFGSIALRLVSLPASEAGCERMFSRRKKIISMFHTRISADLAFARAFLMATKKS